MKGKDHRPVRRARWMRRILVGLFTSSFVITMLCCAASWYIDYRGIARPPALTRLAPILDERLEEVDGVRRIGDNWLAQRDGLMYMSLAGDPFTLGYANGALTQPFLREQEQMMLDLVRSKFSAPWKMWLLKKYVTWRDRDLPGFVPLEYQLEIFGLSTGGGLSSSVFGPTYHVVLNCHAAHDISHMVMDHPLVGCTSFAAWGEYTAGGNLLLGRNFDWQAGECFDRNKIVVRVTPEEGIGFVSVSWPGMAGVVSGMNRERIAVAVNAAQSSVRPEIGVPVSILIREVLQRATTLEEAVQMVRDSQVFVSDSYLIADGKSRRAVVVEKTPAASAIREPGEPMIICANHFLTRPLRDDPANRAYQTEGTSVERYERMEALVREAKGQLTAERTALILRDRRIRGLPSPVIGHPAAVNCLGATHSVIMDVTAGVVWVSNYPHQLGEYIPFQVERFDERPDAAAIPADPILADGSYERCRQASALIAEGRRLHEAGAAETARSRFALAAELNPDHYEPWMHLGRIAFEEKRLDDARRLLERALSLRPAFESERLAIQGMLERTPPSSGIPGT